MNQNIKKLGDILIIQEKSKIKAGEGIDNGKYPFFTCSNDIVKTYNSAQYEGPALIFGTGGRASVHYCDTHFSTSTDCLIYYPRTPDINLDLVNQYLQTNIYLLENGFKGAGLKHISRDYIANIEINLPNIEIQNNIVQKLNKTKNVISNSKKVLAKYDTLIKSRFIEMFGDPSTNPKGWKTVNISEVLDGNTSNGYFAKREEYVADGNVSILGVANIVNTMYSKIENLPKTNATEKDIKKFAVKYGDILFCRSSLVAEGIGKASIVPEQLESTTLFECHVIRLQLDVKKCVPEYLQLLTTTPFFRTQVLAHAKTSTMTTIGQDGILKSNILLPPIELQKDFYNFVQQIDKSKFENNIMEVAA